MGLSRCSEAIAAASFPIVGRRHEPYLWNCLPCIFRTPLPLEAAVLNTTDRKDAFSGGKHLYLVRFNCHVEFLHSECPVSAGSLVVVDGESGVDVGLVLVPGSTDLNPVPRPGLKRGENCYRTSLGLAPPDLWVARDHADHLGFRILQAIRCRGHALGRSHHFLGVEVQADLQYSVVFYRSDEVLCRHEFVPRLFAIFHMRFWFEDVGRTSCERRFAPRKSHPLWCLPSPAPSTPRVLSSDDDETDDSDEVLLPPLPVGVSLTNAQ